MRNSSHTPPPTAGALALGLVFAALGALGVICALAGLAALAPDAEARALANIGHRFPVPSEHTYGDGPGAGRGHQGQDLFADCGKRVLAANGGHVQFRGRDAGAGYYLVIDGRYTRVDYVYMHLRRAGRAQRGERISTGERIGKVGRSGNASGCHLHFELWTAPGWYEGGRFMGRVTTRLRQWDRTS